MTLRALVAVAVQLSVSPHAAVSPAPAFDRMALFDEVHKRIRDEYYDPATNGVDWKAVGVRYRARITQATSEDEAYNVIDEMLAELRDCHTTLVRPGKRDNTPVASWDVGFGVLEVEDRAVVDPVDLSSEALARGLRAGMVVRTVDAEPVQQKLNAVESLLRRESFSTERSRHYLLYKVLFIGPANAEVSADFETRDGSIMRATLRRRTSTAPPITRRRLPSGLGYLRLPSFDGGTNAAVGSALRELRDMRGLIVDLRGNNGGDIEANVGTAGYFLPKGTPLGDDVSRSGKVRRMTAPQSAVRYLGPLAIVVDEGCASGCEFMATYLQEHGRARVVGAPTSGCLLRPSFRTLPGGSRLRFSTHLYRSPKGKKVEGTGVQPDVAITHTMRSLHEGRDAVLEGAEALLKGGV